MATHILKDTVNMEPLIMQWYAWPHLVAPQTLAMNIIHRHLKVMSSFVQAPHLHAQALASTKLKGAPFLDLPAEQVPCIQSLVTLTQESGAELIRFANDYFAFDQVLQKNADGTSLASFYQALPESLAGMVELVYDAHHHPHTRLIEPIVYRKYYNTSLQSICLGEMDNEIRPFTLSTPVIPKGNQLLLSFPFSDSKIDILSRARYQPVILNELLEKLEIQPEQQDLFSQFFVETSSENLSRQEKYSGDDVRIRYFSHACVLIESKDVSILIDPAINFECRQSDRYLNISHIPERINYVLITHNHQDHVLFETLLQLRHRIDTIVVPRPNSGALHDPSLALILRHIGFDNILERGEFDEIKITNGCITALPFLGEHADLYIYSKLSYHVRLLGHTLLFLADSNNHDFKLYQHIFKHVGSIDTLFIGMECNGAPLSWLYGALYSQPILRKIDQSRRLSGSDCVKAMNIVTQSGCRHVYVYAMGLEAWLNNVMAVDYTDESLPIVESNKLLAKCKERGIHAERLFEKKEWIISNE